MILFECHRKCNLFFLECTGLAASLPLAVLAVSIPYSVFLPLGFSYDVFFQYVRGTRALVAVGMVLLWFALSCLGQILAAGILSITYGNLVPTVDASQEAPQEVISLSSR